MAQGGDTGDLHSSAASEEDEETLEIEMPRSPWIVNPDSNARIAWDLSSLFLVVYDMIMIPMAVFAMPDIQFFEVMDWTTRIFWTLDMGWSCLTGVVLSDGKVMYDQREILKRYAKSWLSLDLFIVGSDWAGVALSSGGAQFARLARTSRVAR